MQAVDVRKWNWGDVLTFGLRSSKTSPAGSAAMSLRSSPRTSIDQEDSRPNGNEGSGDIVGKETQQAVEKTEEGEGSENSDGRSVLEAQVDQNALDDAISSKSVIEDEPDEAPSTSSDGLEEDEDEEKKTIREHVVVTPRPSPVLLKKTVYLTDGGDPLATKQRKVHFLLVHPFRSLWSLAPC